MRVLILTCLMFITSMAQTDSQGAVYNSKVEHHDHHQHMKHHEKYHGNTRDQSFTAVDQPKCPWVNVNLYTVKRGYYTCACVEINDPCFTQDYGTQGRCVEEYECPEVDGQPIVNKWYTYNGGYCDTFSHPALGQCVGPWPSDGNDRELCKVTMKKNAVMTALEPKEWTGKLLVPGNKYVTDPANLPKTINAGQVVEDIGIYNMMDNNYGYWMICFTEKDPVPTQGCGFQQWCDSDQYEPLPGLGTSHADGDNHHCGFFLWFDCVYCCPESARQSTQSYDISNVDDSKDKHHNDRRGKTIDDKEAAAYEGRFWELSEETWRDEVGEPEAEKTMTIVKYITDYGTAEYKVSTGCDSEAGWEGIATEADCRTFAKYGNYLTPNQFAAVWSHEPKGCICDDEKVAWNTKGGATGSYHTVCKKSSEAERSFFYNPYSSIGLITGSLVQYFLAFIGLVAIIWKANSIFKCESHYIEVDFAETRVV